MMITLSDLFDRALLKDMLLERYVHVQSHPSLPLNILNYTPAAQYAQKWNEVTTKCRGLIYDADTEEVIARGFDKFFNWDDSSQPYPPSGPVLRSPKMDGSLGILYKLENAELSKATGWSVATRGSFTSDQARMATAMLWRAHDANELDLNDLREEKSYLVEIIYPENRIVVDYGDQRRLVLLDVLDTETGKSDLDEFERVYWLDKVERTYFPKGFSDQFVHDIPEGEEGFVVYWPGKNYRVKMKAAEYLELHRMIFSLSERSIWEALGNDQTIEEICVRLPDEFHAWVQRVAADLIEKRDRICSEARREFTSILHEVYDPWDRKAFAQRATGSPNRAYLFMLYDGKDIQDSIWKTLRPVGGKTVTTISEDVA